MQIKIRSLFIAPKDHVLMQFDFSQAESWIVAYLANEKRMKDALQNGDIHSQTGGIIFLDGVCEHKWKKKLCTLCGITISDENRYIGKRVNHATGYRMKPPKLVTVVNKDSDKPPYVTITLAQGRTYHETWHRYYNVKDWWAEIEEKLNRNRTLVTTYDRERVFFAAWGDELFREATAFEPQSTVADHANGRMHPQLGIPGGFLQVYKQFVKRGACRIINQSHDSIIVEARREGAGDLAKEIHSILQRPCIVKSEMFTIPVDAEIGERWGEMEKLRVI